MYLFVQLDESGFELLIQVATEVVGVLSVRQRHAGLVLFGSEVSLGWGLGHCVQGDLHVVSISVLVELHVRDLLVVNQSGVVGGHITRKLREVRRHCLVLNGL